MLYHSILFHYTPSYTTNPNMPYTPLQFIGFFHGHILPLHPSACMHSVMLIGLPILMTGILSNMHLCMHFSCNNLISWWSCKQPIVARLHAKEYIGALLSHCSKTSVDSLSYPSYSCLSLLLFFCNIRSVAVEPDLYFVRKSSTKATDHHIYSST
jgi:hypothetical protein